MCALTNQVVYLYKGLASDEKGCGRRNEIIPEPWKYFLHNLVHFIFSALLPL